MAIEPFTGVVAGYDPGGNDGHGLALADVRNGRCGKLVTRTLKDAETVVSVLEKACDLLAIGIDTLAAWSTGPSGWRPADLWLRRQYKQVRQSVVSPNGLYGSMGINGMAVLSSVRKGNPQVEITETHPKVLYWALTGSKYDYAEKSDEMDCQLSEWIGVPVDTNSDHEWDAAVSVYAALNGLRGQWTRDLLEESAGETGRLVFPAGQANYWWPE